MNDALFCLLYLTPYGYLPTSYAEARTIRRSLRVVDACPERDYLASWLQETFPGL